MEINLRYKSHLWEVRVRRQGLMVLHKVHIIEFAVGKFEEMAPDMVPRTVTHANKYNR
jgi:hypothetical protein